MSAAGSAHAVPVGERVGRGDLSQPNAEISFGGVMLSRSSMEVRSVTLRLRDVKTPKVITCTSKHNGVLKLIEYVQVDGSAFVETALSYEATPSNNSFSFTVKPDLTADYIYEFRTPSQTPFAFNRCSVKDA